MIKLAVCDDSSLDINKLINCFESCRFTETIQISKFKSGELLVEAHKQNSFQIVLLDIDMPNLNGIDVGKMLRKCDEKVLIIFTTSYPQYAIEAYDCEAFHYLLKPISVEKLETVINRAIHKCRITKKYLKIKIQNKVIQLPISEILYIEYCRKHILYHTENRVIETVGRLCDVLDELMNYGFYQVHQGYIVNFAKVQDFCGYSVILNNGQSVMISVRKKSEVLLAYANYVEDFQ
jgi:DNA-binding LytR/AlgR family response regulator